MRDPFVRDAFERAERGEGDDFGELIEISSVEHRWRCGRTDRRHRPAHSGDGGGLTDEAHSTPAGEPVASLDNPAIAVPPKWGEAVPRLAKATELVAAKLDEIRVRRRMPITSEGP
jgi:hypothetical protein